MGCRSVHGNCQYEPVFMKHVLAKMLRTALDAQG
jgi:hypothetical protein